MPFTRKDVRTTQDIGGTQRARLDTLLTRILAFSFVFFAIFRSESVAQARYSLSFLPDEQPNLICINEPDARALLRAFHQAYVGSDEKPEAVMRRFEAEMGPDRTYDCGWVTSIYVPRIPLVVIDLEEEEGLDWGDKPTHFFVRANILIDGQQYTSAADGDGIYAFTWDFVISKF